MHFLVIIPARAGSKGIPSKNLQKILGKSLIEWSVRHALAVVNGGQILVSSDSPEIIELSKSLGVLAPFTRPIHLSGDLTTTEEVMMHSLQWYLKNVSKPDAIILLQPTSPVRNYDSLKRAIHVFNQSGIDSLLSVCENHHFFWKNQDDPTPMYDFTNRPRRQDISDEDRWFRENGSIYITKTDLFINSGNRLGGKIGMFVMKSTESWEIDEPVDLEIASTLMRWEERNDN